METAAVLNDLEIQVNQLLLSNERLVAENQTLKQKVFAETQTLQTENQALKEQLVKLSQERSKLLEKSQQATAEIKHVIKKLRDNLL